MSTSLTTADHLSYAELLDAWNRGFSGYFVDNTLDEAKLAAHVRRCSIDLSLSPVLRIDRTPAAFSLAAVREDRDAKRAWIGGFGVAPDYRRQGLAGQVMRAQNDLLDAAGIGETWLEVIDINPARRVYAAAGYTEVRALQSFEGPPAVAPAAGRWERHGPGPLAEIHTAVYARSPTGPTWRRDARVLEHIAADMPALEVIGVVGQAGSYEAYAAAVPSADRVSLIDAAASDEVSARGLIAALAVAYEGRPLRLIDEPAESPVAAALGHAGMTPFLSQVEMVRRVV